MKALILVNNNSGFDCEDCVFRCLDMSCCRDDYIIDLLGDCGADSIYQVEEVEVKK